ncbi:hypothetical protein HUU05_20860 [candidate division KSB1 bacterium]|nr:hypothetical protein [candidate division KSB1 bacterium]
MEKPFHHCIEYDTGYTGGAARADCNELTGRFQQERCPSAERQGACLVEDFVLRRRALHKYYNATWKQRSYRRTLSSCSRMAVSGRSRSQWIPADPDDPRVAAFDPSSQENLTELGSLSVGATVLVPRHGDRFLHPAVIFSHNPTDPRCSFVRFPDYQSELLFKSTRVLLLDWEVGVRVACPRVAGGPLFEGTIVTMEGPVWRLDTDKGKILVMSRYCRDLRLWSAAGKQEAFCVKRGS